MPISRSLFFEKKATVRRFLGVFAHLFLIKTALFAQQGLKAEYFAGRNFDQKKYTRTDHSLDFDWRGKTPAPGLDESEFSVRWTTKLTPPKSGTYLFLALVDDGARVYIDGNSVIDAWGDHDSEDFTGKIYLEKGRSYDLVVEYFNGILEGEMHLRWQLPGDEPMFGGLAGYNDRPIDGKYFSLPEKKAQPVAQKTQASPPAPPVLVEKPAKKKPEPTKKPQNKPTPTSSEPSSVSRPTPAIIEKYTPRNIQFVKSKSEMLPESLPELNRLLGMMRDYPDLKLTIEGHTDNIGDAAKNLELSEQRAQAVANYLTKNGVDAARLTSVGFGGSRPISSNDTPELRAKNRRVEFRF